MAGDDDPEVLDLGVIDEAGAAADPPAAGRRRQALSRRHVLTLGGLAAAGGLFVVQRRRSSPPAPTAVPTPTPSFSGTAPTAPALMQTPDLLVTETGHPLLGGPRWDLFGLGDASVLRVELATGRVTRTALEQVTDVELSLVPVRGAVFIHRADYRPGFVVADGRRAVEMPPALDGPGPMLPGPDLDHVWVQAGDDEFARMVLATLDGRPTRTWVDIPSFPTFEPMSDGAGYPLFGAVGGFYRGAPGGPQRITDGVVVATGRTGWLAVECDDRDRCNAFVVDRRGRRREVPGVADPRVPSGVLAPDGATAAIYSVGRPGTLRLTLLDLHTGRRLPIDVDTGEGQGVTSFVWSPDSRWLFAVDAAARLMAVDARTGGAGELVPGLPTVLQIALRAGR